MPKLLYANTKNSDMFYAVRVEVPDPFFFLDVDSKQYIFLDHREFGVFKDKNKNPNIELVLLNPLFAKADTISGGASPVHKLALYLLREYGLADKEIEVSNLLPLDMADYLRANGVHLKITASIYPERVVKRPDEIAGVRESLHRTHSAFQLIEEVLHESAIEGDVLRYREDVLTSELLKQLVEREMLDRDLINTDGIIISCAGHAAIPHHPGTGPLRPHQTIICDIFPRHRASGYYADMTRTYVKGTSSTEIQKLYAAVQEAQEKAIAAVKPGAIGKDIHAICVQTFESKGYISGDTGFIHGTGHGLGLDVHEQPYVNATSTTALQPGHVITIEPGLYYPEIGGVRIEDVVVITENGCDNLTDYHKNYLIA